MSELIVSPAIEEYLEQIYRLETKYGVVRTKQLADLVGVSLGTVTNTIETLEQRNLVVHEPYRGVKLTEEGRKLAIDVVRRHRLIECFLSDFLKQDWSRVHKQACGLEHAITGDLVKPLEKALGHPRTCPHGNPIPSACGISEEEVQPLVDLKIGERSVVAKIVDESEDMLDYLMAVNLVPGAKIEVVGRAMFDGSMIVKIEGHDHPVSKKVASVVWVRKVR
ncbi:MAG: metal-dependent transcriptional regulator [Nitrososphaeria archaeon]